MCRTLSKPGTPYAKTNRRPARPHHQHENKQEGRATLRVNNVPPAGTLCMMISLAASSSPPKKWRFIVLAPRVCIPLLSGKYKYPPFMRQKAQTGLPLRRPSPALIHPSAVPLFPATPQPALWHNAVVAFRAFMLAVVWGRLKTLCVLSWVAREEPAGLRVERQECAYEWASVCRAPADRGDGVPPWVLAHQTNHHVQLHVQHGAALHTVAAVDILLCQLHRFICEWSSPNVEN